MTDVKILTPLLPVEMDFDDYAQSFARGTAPDRCPYGLENLPEGWELKPPSAVTRNRLIDVVRRAVRRLSDADLVGALMRWRDIRDADVIYAHFEADYLGAAFLLRLMRQRRPIVIGHTIWLFAVWDRLPAWKRRLLRSTMRRVDLFVYNAEPNCGFGSTIVPEGRHEYVPFGVSNIFSATPPWSPRDGKPLVLCVGNDRSRDWDVLADALASLPLDVDIRLATSQSPRRIDSAIVRPTGDFAELCELYRTASCLVLASMPNMHAGGITTMLEGAAVGVPIVATDAGGLRAYFGDSEVAYVPPRDPLALRSAIVQQLRNPVEAQRMAQRARSRVRESGYSNAMYWERIAACLDENGLLEESRRFALGKRG